MFPNAWSQKSGAGQATVVTEPKTTKTSLLESKFLKAEKNTKKLSPMS